MANVKEVIKRLIKRSDFDVAWRQVHQPDATFLDAINVFRYAEISNFYGKGNIAKRREWARIFTKMTIQLPKEQMQQAVDVVVASLSPDKQVWMMCELFEHSPKDYLPVLDGLFTGILIHYYANGAQPKAQELFNYSIQMSSAKRLQELSSKTKDALHFQGF